MTLGTKLTQMRNQRKLSQQEVADAINKTQASYSKIESDITQPRLETLEKLAEFYGINMAELLQDDKNVFNIHGNTNMHNINGILIQPNEAIIKAKDETITALQSTIQSCKAELAAERTLSQMKDEKINLLQEKLSGLSGRQA